MSRSTRFDRHESRRPTQSRDRAPGIALEHGAGRSPAGSHCDLRCVYDAYGSGARWRLFAGVGACHLGILKCAVPMAADTGGRLVAEAVPVDPPGLAAKRAGTFAGHLPLLPRSCSRNGGAPRPGVPPPRLPLRLRLVVGALALRVPEGFRGVLADSASPRRMPFVRALVGFAPAGAVYAS